MDKFAVELKGMRKRLEDNLKTDNLTPPKTEGITDKSAFRSMEDKKKKINKKAFG